MLDIVWRNYQVVFLHPWSCFAVCKPNAPLAIVTRLPQHKGRDITLAEQPKKHTPVIAHLLVMACNRMFNVRAAAAMWASVMLLKVLVTQTHLL